MTPYQGLFSINKVYDNGTICLKVGAVKKNANFRRLTPYISAFSKVDTIDPGGEGSKQKTLLRVSARKQPPRA